MKFIFTLRILKLVFVFFLRPHGRLNEAFLEMFAKYFVTFEQFFEYEKYFYRVFTLGIMGKDYKALAKILYAFSEMMNKLNTKAIYILLDRSIKNQAVIRNVSLINIIKMFWKT